MEAQRKERSYRKLARLACVSLLAAVGISGGILFALQDEAIAAGADQVVVRARGIGGSENMALLINGERVNSWTVSTRWSTFTFQVESSLAVESVEVAFTNDLGDQRDLLVDYVDVGGIRLESEASSTISTGTFVPGPGCIERPSHSQALHCAGSFRYSVPVGTVLGRPEASGAVVSVRARGRTGSEEIHLRINDEVVRAFTASTTWETFVYDAPRGTTIQNAEVAFVNDNGERDIRVDWLEVDGRRYQSEDSTTKARGTWTEATGCQGRTDSDTEWLRCNGWFRYPIGSPAADLAAAIGSAAASLRSFSANAPAAPAPTPQNETVSRPVATTPTTAAPTTTTAAPTTTTAAPRLNTQTLATGNGRYSIAQVIDGTIGAGDGSNPNEESPMGRHDAPLALPQGWNWTQGPTRNGVWGQLGTGASRFVEWRCAVIPERGHTPNVPFRINVRNGAYYQFVNGNWNKAFDVDLTGGNHGGYLGIAGRENQNPFDSGSHGQIQWRREADGSFSAPWNQNALMMHFWASQRQLPAPGQTAEFLTSEVRLQQPDGRTVDLSQVNVLFQCGIDYYNTTGGQGTRVPGPGIAKYHRATPNWQPGLWVTLPGSAPAGSVDDFRSWLSRNTPPGVG